MSRGRKFGLWFLAIFFGTPLALYGWYKWSFPTYSWNQKLTVEVMTPDGPVSGSAVTSVTWWAQPPIGGAPGVSYRYTGEAAIVDLGGGRYLFAVHRGEGNLGGRPERIVAMAIFPTRNGQVNRRWLSEIEDRHGPASGTIVLKPDNYPLLVTFDDINDPASVKQVVPDNLAASFGPGYALQRISVEVTGERKTVGRVEAVLPWLAAVGRERATLIPNPPRFLKDAEPIQLLKPSAFSTELYK